MMRKMRTGGIAAMVAALALFATACGGNDTAATPTETPSPAATDEAAAPTPTPDATPTGETQTITWWHNGTGEPLYSFWNDVAKEFETANPGVTVNVQAFQNEELRNTVLPNAFVGGTAPDLFQSWGGGELVDWVNEGIVMDISSKVEDIVAEIGTPVAGWQVDGRTYGLPFTFGPSGFWVNTDLWHEAGLTDFPTTLDQLEADWQTLRDHGITPVALGGGDTWPAAHWYYWAAARSCPATALKAAQDTHDFCDPCWEQAGDLLKSIMDTDPFNAGWQATSAQQGAASSAGMVITGQAAMELMGVWNAGVMGGIYNEAKNLDPETPPPAFLGWFPFPAVTGAAGADTIMGGGDGFSVHADAPDAAVELLRYIMSTDVQTRYAAFQNIPTVPAAASALTFEPLIEAQRALEHAGHVQLWLDTAVGSEISATMNPAMTAFMNGEGTPRDVAEAIRTAAGNSCG